MRKVTAWLTVLLVGCGSGAGGQTVRELGGEDRPLEVTRTELYRLGGATGAGWQAFERIRNVGFDGQGRLHLFDQGSNQVHVVRRDGGLVRSLGRRGDGPGELSAGVGMAVGPDGMVAVQDLGRRSLALFGPDGDYRENVALDGSKGRISSLVLDGRGNAVGVTAVVWMGRRGSSELTLMIPADGGQLPGEDGLPVLRAPLDGGEATVLARAWAPPRRAIDGTPVEVAFAAGLRWALLPDGRVAFADSTGYEIEIVGSGPGTLLRRDVPPRRVTEEERNRELDRRAAGEGGGSAAGVGPDRETARRGMIRQRRAALEASIDFPEVHQVVRGLRSDPDGRLWVERVGRDVFTPGPIDVIMPNGSYLGTIPEGTLDLPDALGPDGLAVWLTRDDLDVPVVEVSRITIR